MFDSIGEAVRNLFKKDNPKANNIREIMQDLFKNDNPEVNDTPILIHELPNGDLIDFEDIRNVTFGRDRRTANIYFNNSAGFVYVEFDDLEEAEQWHEEFKTEWQEYKQYIIEI
jgi:hypothetical protein